MPILGIYASAQQASNLPTSFESIATVTVGSGGSSSIEFTSIPNTYKHLQIRGITRNNSVASNDLEGILVQYNSDTATNYSWHYLKGDGSATGASAGASQSYIYSGYSPSNGSTANAFSSTVIDILDYADTNKYKTQRVLSGYDNNAASTNSIALWSGNWRSTSAITSIKLYSTGSKSFVQYSSFALYGIKGA